MSVAVGDAEAVCARRGVRLTPIRRQVLTILASVHKPLGAYEIMDQVAAQGRRPAPITVYRALDFLLENGLAHRIASRNAFMACIQAHGASETIVFMLCERCGTVGEAISDAVRDTLDQAAKSAGFSARARVVEISGLCAHCGPDGAEHN
jgi:Fur family zinc uptake transcriptional regulator